MADATLAAYIDRALSLACVEPLEEGGFFASIPEFPGPWARGETAESCLRELRAAFEEWLVIALRADDDLPVLEGLTLNFGGKRWRKRSAAAS